MERLVQITNVLLGRSQRYDDDWVDRLHHTWTSGALVLFSLVVGSKQFVGDPIVCWTGTHEQHIHERYINTMCWIANTYWVPIEEQLPDTLIVRRQMEITYYQWVPLALLIQACFFYAPRLVWRALSHASDFRIDQMVKCGIDSRLMNSSSDAYERCIRQLAYHLKIQLDLNYQKQFECCASLKQCLGDHLLRCGRRYGNWLFLSYIVSKILFFAGAVGQMIGLNVFLGGGMVSFYDRIVLEYFDGDFSFSRGWMETGRFPRITMCDFQVRVLGQIQGHTVQCSLPINLFNEKIYLALWLWLGVLSILTIVSLVVWICRMAWPVCRRRHVRRALRLRQALTAKHSHEQLSTFVSQYLHPDGLFVLLMIGDNCGQLVMIDVIDKLWRQYYQTYGPSQPLLMTSSIAPPYDVSPSAPPATQRQTSGSDFVRNRQSNEVKDPSSFKPPVTFVTQRSHDSHRTATTAPELIAHSGSIGRRPQVPSRPRHVERTDENAVKKRPLQLSFPANQTSANPATTNTVPSNNASTVIQMSNATTSQLPNPPVTWHSSAVTLPRGQSNQPPGYSTFSRRKPHLAPGFKSTAAADTE